MSGTDQFHRRAWSTRQRLVVLTFDTVQQAHQYDLLGQPPAEALIEGFEIEDVDGRAVVLLMERCRDVIDEWDDLAVRDERLDGSTMGAAVDRLRRALYDARQGAIK